MANNKVGRKPFTEEQRKAAYEKRKQKNNERNKVEYAKKGEFRDKAIRAAVNSRRTRNETEKILRIEEELNDNLYYYYMKCVNQQVI